MRPGIRSLVLGALLFGATAPSVHAATPWMWDRDSNRIDDRIEAVEVGGLAAAHVGGLLSNKLILFVSGTAAPFTYGTYVQYDHMPTDADVAALTATGATLSWRPRYIPYLRANATLAQLHAIVARPGVTRAECWQAMYKTNDNATRALRARDAAGGVGHGMFPSVWKEYGYTGKGIVVGILDSGVNDAPMSGGYPGHESLRGKFVGGGDFSNPVAALNTPPDGSANPQHTADPEDTYHGTHVAGIAVGSGGPNGLLNGAAPGWYAGMAPDARLADCKVLTDAGVGGGAAEALEWCIAHRNTVWSTPEEPGVTYKGVQVVNMSIGGASESDGTDADCAAVNAAVKAGIVCCVATGNDGNTAYMPSPAAADLDIAVGALNDGNTLDRADDIVDNYSNEGPRQADADADHVDEMKPSVCGSGSDIMSAFGTPNSDGTKYHNINGTSMASPTIAGLCALIRQANPGLTPAQVRDVLQNTSDHRTDHGQQPPSASDPFGIDPNYHPSWGWGEPDAVAAVLEALDANTTQVIAQGTTGVSLVAGHPEIGVRWTTQREDGVTAFQVWRAPDLGGYPGVFAQASPDVTPTGHAVIERTSNRTHYTWTDTDASLVAGASYWYQVRFADGRGYAHAQPAFKVSTDVPEVRARVRWAITHSALDNDVVTTFGVGTDPEHPVFWRPTGGKAIADSSHQFAPGFGDGITRFYFHADLTDADLVDGFLPPSLATPWFLSVAEAGYVNTEGAVDSFSVTVYDNGAPTTYTSLSPTTPTIEGEATVFWIPANPGASPNHAPVFDATGDRTVGEGLALSFTVHATDADGGQTLTYAADNVPAGATFDAGTRTFSWTPAHGAAGTYPVRFRVTDSFLLAASDTEQVTVTVTPRAPGSNTSPSLEPIGDRSGPATYPIAFTVTAHDAENDALTYSMTGLPSGATFDAATRRFAWTPAIGQEGFYTVTAQVADGAGGTDSQPVLVTVTYNTAPPVSSGECSPDTTQYSGTIGANVQGLMAVDTYHAFTVAPNTANLRGILDWTGGPAIDLDLYLLDAQGNTVASGATATEDPEIATYVDPAPGNYQWKVSSFDNPNSAQAYTLRSIACITTQTTGVGAGGMQLALSQNAPNPFDRSAMIRFTLPVNGPVSLRIYDLAGRRVRTLVQGTIGAGWHQRVWDGRDDRGVRLSAGTYFYRLETGQGTRTRKMVMLK